LQIESRIPVGLKEGEVVQWELFPNPSQGVIELAGIENSATARVFNVLGTLIFSRELSKNSRKIDLSNQPKGLYIIEVKNNREFFRKRVIIH